MQDFFLTLISPTMITTSPWPTAGEKQGPVLQESKSNAMSMLLRNLTHLTRLL